MLLQSVTSSEEWDDVLLLHMVSSSVVLPRHLHHLSLIVNLPHTVFGWNINLRRTVVTAAKASIDGTVQPATDWSWRLVEGRCSCCCCC